MTKVIVVHPMTWEPLTVVEVPADQLEMTHEITYPISLMPPVAFHETHVPPPLIDHIRLRIQRLRPWTGPRNDLIYFGVPDSTEHLDKLPHVLLPAQKPKT